jgi:hypothetical protein
MQDPMSPEFHWAMIFMPWAMMSLLFIPLAIGNYFLAGRLGRNPVLWAVLTVIPIVNFVFLYVAMYRVVFYVLDRLNELSGRQSTT